MRELSVGIFSFQWLPTLWRKMAKKKLTLKGALWMVLSNSLTFSKPANFPLWTNKKKSSNWEDSHVSHTQVNINEYLTIQFVFWKFLNRHIFAEGIFICTEPIQNHGKKLKKKGFFVTTECKTSLIMLIISSAMLFVLQNPHKFPTFNSISCANTKQSHRNRKLQKWCNLLKPLQTP